MAKLAINGGDKTIGRELGRKWPIYDESEEKALLDVLHSGMWWRGGERLAGAQSKVTAFEDAFAAYQGAKYGVAVTNGSVAMECALRAAGVEAGHEVIVPALTFISTVTSVLMVNAIPVLVDIDPGTLDLDPDAFEAAITPRTKAVLVVHMGGYPADMDRLIEIANRHGVVIVEDAAHAHGSEWRGQRVGALSGLGTFSFQATKAFSGGEGGLVVTNDEAYAERAFSYHHIGRLPGRPFYEFHQVGTNLRMTEWQGAILLAQFARLDEQIATRERNAAYLARGLQGIDGVKAIARDPRVTRWGFYFWNFLYDQEAFGGVPRDIFIQAVRAEGAPIGPGGHGEPIYRHPALQPSTFGETGCPIRCPLYQGEPVDFSRVHCPQAEHVAAHVALRLPHAAFLGGPEDMDLLLEAIRKVRANLDELRAWAGRERTP